MIITLAGDLCSGKSTVRKLLAQKLNYKHISAGDLFRQQAAENNMSIHEYNKVVEKNPHMDQEMDESIARMAREEGKFIADGHVLWHFLPESTKVFLEVDIDEATKRLFDEKRSSEKENKTLEATKQGLISRAAGEEIRYQKVYGIQYRNLDNFDLVINTTSLSPEEVVDQIINHLEAKSIE